MNQLTPEEERTVLFIREFIKLNRYPPSFREIAAGANLNSMEKLSKTMKTIREKGYIGYIDRKSRALWMTEKGKRVKLNPKEVMTK